MFKKTATGGQMSAADVALVWLTVGVQIRVSLHLQLGDVRFAANTACESLVAGVNTLVVDQRVPTGHPATTHIAREIPIFTCMPKQMIFDRRLEREAAAADGALERARILMHGAPVLLQVGAARELVTTDVALERLKADMVVLMRA